MLQLNKNLFSTIYEEIHNIENKISDYREIILQINTDIAHINLRISQAQNKSFGYKCIPDMFSLREYFLLRKQRYQFYIDNALSSISKLRKRILTG